MTYPRSYPTSDGTPLGPEDWNPVKDFIDGFTASGTFQNPYSFLISYDGTDYSASNAFQIVYGGASDVGGVDGADCNAVIQAAVDAVLAAGCGGLVFKGGEHNIYTLDDTIEVDMRSGKSNFYMIGEPGATLFASTHLVGDIWDCFVEFFEGTNIIIRGLIFDCDNTDTHFGIHCSGYDETNNVEVSNCQFKNFIHSTISYLNCCFDADKGSNYWIHDNYFENCEIGIAFEAYDVTMNNIDLYNNTFVGCGHGIDCEQGHLTGEFVNLKIHDNKFFGKAAVYDNSGDQTYGFNVFGAGSSRNVSITNNTVKGEPSEICTGISVQRVDGPVISGNIMTNTEDTTTAYEGGIKVRGCPNASITGNKINTAQNGICVGLYTETTDYSSISGNTIANCNYGMYIHRSDYCTVSANTIYNSTTDGIKEVTDSNHNTYIGNIIEGSGGNAITPVFTAGGAYNIYSHNTGYVTEMGGSSAILNATTSIAVTHGCSYTPVARDITITPTAATTNDPGLIWVNTIGAVTFTVNCTNDPGASTLAFNWAVRKTDNV